MRLSHVALSLPSRDGVRVAGRPRNCILIVCQT
jgi:hypothetical protein